MYLVMSPQKHLLGFSITDWTHAGDWTTTVSYGLVQRQTVTRSHTGGLKTRDWKSQDWKTRDQISRGGKGGTS